MKAFNNAFGRFARMVSSWTGSPYAFSFSVILLLGWAISGPLFGFSEQWQLFINSFTTVVTFLVVFLIQNTQNHDSRALHAKLDELIVKLDQPDSSVAGAEKLSEEDLDSLST